MDATGALLGGVAIRGMSLVRAGAVFSFGFLGLGGCVGFFRIALLVGRERRGAKV